jgi:hypothetical protein
MTAMPRAMAPAAPQSGGPATELLDLMMRLADLLAHETERVRSGHVQDVAPLQREKIRLSQLYQRKVQEVEASGAKIASLPAPLRAQIVAASGRLADEAAENERALRIGRDATHRLLDMVVASIKMRVKPASRYDAHSALRPARMVPCAVDRRL